jgi:hypothetical protein
VTHLDGLSIKTKSLLLVGQEVLDVFALITLELDDFAHLGVAHDGSITGKLLFDHFEDLLLVKFLGKTLDGRQGLAAIALCGVLALVLSKFIAWQRRAAKDSCEVNKRVGCVVRTFASACKGGERRTLDTNMNVILLSLLDLAGIFIRFRERV